jgi:hypothetical protein
MKAKNCDTSISSAPTVVRPRPVPCPSPRPSKLSRTSPLPTATSPTRALRGPHELGEALAHSTPLTDAPRLRRSRAALSRPLPSRQYVHTPEDRSPARHGRAAYAAVAVSRPAFSGSASSRVSSRCYIFVPRAPRCLPLSLNNCSPTTCTPLF